MENTAKPLSDWDRRLLDRYLRFYRSLHCGQRRPETNAQRRFVAVCSGEARPQSQHEIAYWRLLQLEQNGFSGYPPTAPKVPASRVSATSRVNDNHRNPVSQVPKPKPIPIAVVDSIESQEYQPYTPKSARVIMDQIKSLYISGKARAQTIVTDASIWLNAILSESSFTDGLTGYFTDRYGHVSNIYTEAMDGSFLLKSNELSPVLHRLFEGHAPLEAWQRVQGALPDDTQWEEVRGYIEAMWSDMVTPAGMPLFTIEPGAYEKFTDLTASLNIPAEWVRDILTYDAVEVIQGILPIIPLILAWDDTEAEKFAKLVGALGVGTVVAANPISAVVAVVMLARGIHNTRHQRDYIGWATGLAKGGTVSGAILIVSSVVSGPIWIGMVVALAIGIYLSRNLDTVTVEDLSNLLKARILEPQMAK